jgi:hypothetical protein
MRWRTPSSDSSEVTAIPASNSLRQRLSMPPKVSTAADRDRAVPPVRAFPDAAPGGLGDAEGVVDPRR